MLRFSSSSLVPALASLFVVAASGCLYFEPWVYCDDDDDCGGAGVCVVDPERGPRCLLEGEDLADFQKDAGVVADAGADLDSGPSDSGLVDSGLVDSGSGDSGTSDSGTSDAGEADAGEDDLDGGSALVPTQPVIALLPAAPLTQDDLTLSLETPSVSNVTVSYQVAWFRGSSEQADLADEWTVPAARTNKGDTWRAVVTPSAAGVTGPFAEAQVFVGNTPPALQGVALYPVEPRPGERLRAIPVGWSDVDPGDTQQIDFRWIGVRGDGSTEVLGTAPTLPFPFDPAFVRYRVEVTPTNSGAPTPGDTVVSCDRQPPANAPAWRLHHPPSLDGLGLLSTPSVLDLAHDRILFGASLIGGYAESAFEYSLAAGTPWHRLDIAPTGGETLFSAQLALPGRDAVLRFGGNDKDTSTPVSDTALLSLAHGCESWTTLSTTGAPALTGVSLVWDATRERALVLFGRSGAPPSTQESTAVHTVELTAAAAAFTELVTTNATGGELPGRIGATAAYDAVRDQILVYGGLAPDFTAARGDVLALSLASDPPVWRAVLRANPPAPRLGAGVALWPEGDALVVVGGCTVGADLSDCDPAANDEVFLLDLTLDEEAWSETSVSPALPGNILGFHHHPGRGTFLALVQRADPPQSRDFLLVELTPASPSWTAAVLWDSRDGAPAGRGHHGATLLGAGEDEAGDPVVFYGGFYETWQDDADYDDAWRWDVSAGRWQVLPQSALRPSPRSSFAYAEGDLAGEHRSGPPLFVAGGRCEEAGSFTLCDDLWRGTWTGSELVWTEGPAPDPKPSARVAAAGAIIDSGPYPRFRVYGGQRADLSVLDEDWTFSGAGVVSSFENGTWSLETGTGWPARSRAALVPSRFSGGNRAYLVGGYDGSGVPQAGVWVSPLNLDASDEWQPVDFDADGPLPARAGASATAVSSGTVVVYGGEGQSGPLDDVWLFRCLDELDASHCSSHDVTASIAGHVPDARAHHSALYDPETDTLWIFGGYGSVSDADTPRELWSLAPLAALLGP